MIYGTSSGSNFSFGGNPDQMYQERLKAELHTIKESLTTDGLFSVFKMPVYQLCPDPIQVRLADQINKDNEARKNLFNNPEYHRIWAICSQGNPNPK